MKNRSMVCLACAIGSASAFGQYSVFATESFSGSLGGNTTQYGGIQQYNFSGPGGSPTTGPGLPASQLQDPVGLRNRQGKLYIGNRVGNTLGQGSAMASVLTGTTAGAPAVIATQSSSSFAGFHGLDVAPNSDLFVATVSGGTRWYRDSGSGYADIGGTASALVRDAFVSPDGKKLYETIVDRNELRVTDILGNTFGSSSVFALSGASSPHQITMRNGRLYTANFSSSNVSEVVLDANGLPVSTSIVASVSSAIGITFSPDGNEMFVSSHTGNMLTRLGLGQNGWSSTGSWQTGRNMGYLATAVPEPTTMVALAVGTALVARRRCKPARC